MQVRIADDREAGGCDRGIVQRIDEQAVPEIGNDLGGAATFRRDDRHAGCCCLDEGQAEGLMQRAIDEDAPGRRLPIQRRDLLGAMARGQRDLSLEAMRRYAEAERASGFDPRSGWGR